MGRMIRRAIIPILLLVAGIASLLYGVLYHRAQVGEETKVTVKIPIPSPFGPFVPPGAEAQPPGADEQLSSDDLPSPLGGDKDEQLSSDDLPSPGDVDEGEKTPAAKKPNDEKEEKSPFETPAEPPGMPQVGPRPPMGGPPWFGPAGMPGMPGGPPQFRTEPETRLVFHEVSEPAMVREATFGGVTRLANGQLKKTYSGKAPSLCPT